MYTMVLMMAASSSGESPDFFRHGSGCTGSTVVVAAAPVGCTGSAPVGCSGSAPTGCHGSKAGFLGIRACLFGRKAPSTGCSGCTGYVAPSAGCTGYVAPSAGCTGHHHSGCIGSTTVMAPSISYAPAGCMPSMGTVIPAGPGAGTSAPPVTMPEVKKDPETKKEPEPKKDTKKDNDL